MRPQRLVLVTGTATEVGKTWVGAALLRTAREAGLTVAARKPAQSHHESDALRDADILASATGEAPSTVCPDERTYPVPMAPPMAADVLGRPAPDMCSLLADVEASWPDPAVDLAVVEGAGGVASPLAADGDSADLARGLPADTVVLVADPALGVINSVRLSVDALEPLPVVVHLNRFDASDDLQRRNRDWLVEADGLTVTTDMAGLLAAVLRA